MQVRTVGLLLLFFPVTRGHHIPLTTQLWSLSPGLMWCGPECCASIRTSTVALSLFSSPSQHHEGPQKSVLSVTLVLAVSRDAHVLGSELLSRRPWELNPPQILCWRKHVLRFLMLGADVCQWVEWGSESETFFFFNKNRAIGFMLSQIKLRLCWTTISHILGLSGTLLPDN